MMIPSDLFQDWRKAHEAATAAEKAMADRSILALEGQGEPPSATEAQQAKRLRASANDVFERAMAVMDEFVRSNAHRSRVRDRMTG
jgi:hypothetical protein